MDLSGWVLSIAGMVILTVIVDIIIPEGQTYKVIKGVFAFVTVLVIAAPLPKLLNADFDFSRFFNGESNYVGYDQTLSDSIYEMRLEQTEERIQRALNNKGVQNAVISIESVNENSFAVIKKVEVNLSKAVINAVDGNIISVDEIDSIVAVTAGISCEVVFVYGG